MQLRCLLLLLPIAGLVAPAAAISSDAPVAFGGVVVSSVSEALRETLGPLAADGGDAGDFTTAEAQAVHLKFMIKANDAGTATSICTAADALGLPSKCDYTYTTLFHGAAVTATLPQLQALLGDHDGAVSEAEASLQVHTTDIQSPATWGLDRIDQDGLPLDNSYEYDSEGGNGAKVFVIDTGVRAYWPTALASMPVLLLCCTPATARARPSWSDGRSHRNSSAPAPCGPGPISLANFPNRF